jgi:hypothetical protein
VTVEGNQPIHSQTKSQEVSKTDDSLKAFRTVKPCKLENAPLRHSSMLEREIEIEIEIEIEKDIQAEKGSWW